MKKLNLLKQLQEKKISESEAEQLFESAPLMKVQMVYSAS